MENQEGHRNEGTQKSRILELIGEIGNIDTYVEMLRRGSEPTAAKKIAELENRRSELQTQLENEQNK